jgi:hypothetical protein
MWWVIFCVLIVVQLFISSYFISWVILCVLIVVQLFISSQYFSWVILCVLIVDQLFISSHYYSWVILYVVIVVQLFRYVTRVSSNALAMGHQDPIARLILVLYPFSRHAWPGCLSNGCAMRVRLPQRLYLRRRLRALRVS